MINDSINRFLGILCYPFASMEMFKEDQLQNYIEALDEECTKKTKAEKIKEQLKKDLVNYIRQNYTIYSYDEIYLYLDKCYLFDIKNDDVKIENMLDFYCRIMKDMATTLISHRDGKIVFKYWKNEKDEELFGGFAEHNKVALFHSLNCHIPMDVIAIIYMLNNSQGRKDIRCLNYFYGNIEVADQQLSRILERGVAENHLHKGVSRTFPSIWDSLMEPVTAKNKDSFYKTEFISGTEDQDKWMLFCILACGLVRALLVLEIAKIHLFEFWFKDSCDSGIYKLVRDFCDGRALELYCENEFKDKDKKEIVSHCDALWEELDSLLPFDRNYCKTFLTKGLEMHTFDENIFLYYALPILFDETADIVIRKCIMQYLRIRNYLFRVSVQQKTIKGLDYFQQEHYRVSSALAHINIDNFWENAIREQLQSQNIHKIEFRSSFPKKASQLKKDVIRFLNAYYKILEEDYCYKDDKEENIVEKKIPQVGLVLHFLKRPDETVPEKCFENGKEDCSYFQFGELQQNYRTQIESFVKLRKEEPELSRYLVGIDAASLENATPLWVFAPIYEKARDGQRDQIGRYENKAYVQSLGFTFHAGEDFRHILSGLRRIDEAVEFLKFHAGDRIGHGIVLGLSAKEWKAQNPVVIIPQIEALENYLWAYDMLSKNYSNFQATILAYMEKKILDLAKKIYGSLDGLTVGILVSGYQKMFESDVNGETFQERYVGERQNLKTKFCEKIWNGETISWTENLLVMARHCKSFVKEMERAIHYEVTEQDLIIIEELQKILIEKLGKKGIVIEVNPSSNTAIADLDTFKENQFYRINHTNGSQNLIVCVNSDDPAVFNTNVSNELAYIYYGMLEQNINRESALKWIDQVRENGINSSFIHRQESDQIILKNLVELLDKYNK